MIYKKYGQTGIEVSVIGFGGMRFEHPDDFDEGAAVVKSAYDAGMNYFDTAPGYPKSEETYGVAFKEMLKTRAEKPFYVSTKSMGRKPEDVRRDIETSLKKMGLDYIDFFHCWCIIRPDEYEARKAAGVLDEFEKLKEEGLVKHIVVSTHMTGSQIGEMLEDYPFEGVLLGYSVMNFPYRDAGLDAAAKLGRGVVAMNPLGGGIIPQNPELFDFVRTQQDETVVEAAVRFLINDPRITIALVGFANQKQLDESLRAVDGFKPIPKETIERIRNSLNDSFNEMCTGCGYCDQCPQGIDVPKVMQSYNHYMLNAKDIDLINMLRYCWDIDVQSNYLMRCTECGKCEKLCTQKLPIRRRIHKTREIIEQWKKEEAEKK